MNLSKGIKDYRLDSIQLLLGPSPLLEILSGTTVIASGNLPAQWLTKANGSVSKSGLWELKALKEGKPSAYRITGGGEEISGDISKMSLILKQGQSVIVDKFEFSE